MTTHTERQTQKQLDKWYNEYIRKWKKAPTLEELSEMKNRIIKNLNEGA